MCKYFSLGKGWLLVLMGVVMCGWMFLYAYQYMFLNAQGEMNPEDFDKGAFALQYGGIILAEAFIIFMRGMITFSFGLMVSDRLMSLSRRADNTQSPTA